MGIKNETTIKRLKSQLSNLDGELTAIKVDLSNKQKEYNQKKKVFDSLLKKIKELNNPQEPDVSEHAIIRYFERVRGENIDEIKREILSEEVMDMIEKLGGSGKYPNKDYGVVIKNNVVVTIV